MRGTRLLLAAGMVLAARCATTDIGEIPPAPDASVTTSQATSTFAIDELLLGEADSRGLPSITAWRVFGYDLDGLATTATSTNVCTLALDAATVNQVDGVDGIDNAWGALLLPALQSLLSTRTVSTVVSGHLTAGDWTLQIQVTGLSPDPHQTAIGLGAEVFVSGPSDGTPSFDTTTDWPVLPSSLRDGTTLAGGARVRFDDVYVTNGTLVARGAMEPLVLPIVYNPPCADPVACAQVPRLELPLRVYHPTLTFEHVDQGTAANGVIAGVLATQEVVDAFRRLLGLASTTFCGSAFDGLATELRQSQDILSDGTNSADVPCDAISVGIGFTAKLVANPTKVGTEPPPRPDPCDGGNAGDAGPD